MSTPKIAVAIGTIVFLASIGASVAETRDEIIANQKGYLDSAGAIAPVAMDWKSVKDMGKADNWRNACIRGSKQVGRVCERSDKECEGWLKSNVKAIQCVAQEKKYKAESASFALKGDTLTYRMVQDSLSDTQAREAAMDGLPKLGLMLMQKEMKKAKSEFEDTIGRFVEKSDVFKPKVSLRWSAITQRKEIGDWSGHCARAITQATDGNPSACEVNGASGKHILVDECVAYLNQKVKSLECVPQESAKDKKEARIELKGSAATYYMTHTAPSGQSISPTSSDISGLWFDTLPELLNIRVDKESFYYLSGSDSHKENFKNAPLDIDVRSFSSIGKRGPDYTQCVSAWQFLDQINEPECQLKSCRGDAKKKEKFIKGAKKIRCVYTKTEKTAEVKGDTLLYYVGKWMEERSARDFMHPQEKHFMALRKKLKIRGCGVDMYWANPRTSSQRISSNSQETCCAKKGNKCVSTSYFKDTKEVCAKVGFGNEKKCHSRKLLDKKTLKSAK